MDKFVVVFFLIVSKTHFLTSLDVLTTLIEWTMEGLSLDVAMAQPETAYKVRHLKMGVMMAGVLCTCDPYTSFRMLVCMLYLFPANLLNFFQATLSDVLLV